MTILLILIACIKGIVLFLGIDKIARISQSKNYMMGALIASFAVGAYSQKSVHDYMGSPGIEGFFFTLILFAIVSALGFVYCWLLYSTLSPAFYGHYLYMRGHIDILREQLGHLLRPFLSSLLSPRQ